MGLIENVIYPVLTSFRLYAYESICITKCVFTFVNLRVNSFVSNKRSLRRLILDVLSLARSLPPTISLSAATCTTHRHRDERPF